MTDRVERLGHAKDLKLAFFEREIMKETDLYKVQELCVRLFAQTLSQQAVYESLLRNPLPKMP